VKVVSLTVTSQIDAGSGGVYEPRFLGETAIPDPTIMRTLMSSVRVPGTTASLRSAERSHSRCNEAGETGSVIRHRLLGSGLSRCAFRHRSQMSGRALAVKAPGKPRHIWREPSVIPQSVEDVSGLVGQPLRAVCSGRAGRWILAMGLRV